MKSLLTIAAVLMFSVTGLAQEVTLAKAAELTAHRIDRLVTLGKIDSGFISHLDSIEIAPTADKSAGAFRAVASQTQPETGAALKLEVYFDEKGKALSYQVLPDGEQGPDNAWTEKDAASLMENALHYVLENNGDETVALFDQGLSSIKLIKVQQDGKEMALGVMHSTLTNLTLNVYLNLDGSFVAAEVAQ
ncbi:hypothetical protein [Bdellovibrio bacteriovorus]|uniref:Uncharacterized protein n=1 Tax=Bdellovibrio bacteriovorus TaxID=959 RepID=A0A1Z3N777_BDEBC|nr:hypothetical protein [Bdellovibrio bacteriovorus]ASD63271.1 hypothetical protein B9G79_06660 [Bdellovibrio bacteriovorus]